MQEHRQHGQHTGPPVGLIHPVEPAEQRLEDLDANRQQEAPCHQDDRGGADEQPEGHRAAFLTGRSVEREPADEDRRRHGERTDPSAKGEVSGIGSCDGPVATPTEGRPADRS